MRVAVVGPMVVPVDVVVGVAMVVAVACGCGCCRGGGCVCSCAGGWLSMVDASEAQWCDDP